MFPRFVLFWLCEFIPGWKKWKNMHSIIVVCIIFLHFFVCILRLINFAIYTVFGHKCIKSGLNLTRTNLFNVIFFNKYCIPIFSGYLIFAREILDWGLKRVVIYFYGWHDAHCKRVAIMYKISSLFYVYNTTSECKKYTKQIYPIEVPHTLFWCQI